MDAYSMEVVARTRIEDAHRDAELRQLIRTARQTTEASPSAPAQPSRRWLRRLVRSAAAA